MIQINPNSEYNSKRLERIMKSFNSGRYQFDAEMIRNDIKRFALEAENENNKSIKTNKERISKYLRDMILANLNRFNRLKVKWIVDKDGTVRTTPIPLLNLRWCGFDIIDYTYKTDEHVVSVSYKELWDAMAFVIAHYDLGFSTKEIEEKIKDCSIVAINDSKMLGDLIDENTYNDVNIMLIDECLYVSKGEECTARNYFGETMTEITYPAILSTSIKRMMNCIIDGLLNSLPKEEGHVEFLGLFEDRLYFNTSMNTKSIHKHLGQGVLFRMFGRDFEFKPKVKID